MLRGMFLRVWKGLAIGCEWLTWIHDVDDPIQRRGHVFEQKKLYPNTCALLTLLDFKFKNFKKIINELFCMARKRIYVNISVCIIYSGRVSDTKFLEQITCYMNFICSHVLILRRIQIFEKYWTVFSSSLLRFKIFWLL